MNDFHLKIYNKILNGEHVHSFEQWLFNKLSPKEMQRLNSPYYRVRDLLVRDFKNGDSLKKVRFSIRRYLNWLWEHDKLKVESSVCNPHSRRLGDLILYYDGTLRNIKTQNVIINPTLNEEGYATFGGKLIHRLMAEAWFVNPDSEEYCEVNHKNKNRSDNNIENLELLDHENNILHRDGKEYHAAPRYYTQGR